MKNCVTPFYSGNDALSSASLRKAALRLALWLATFSMITGCARYSRKATAGAPPVDHILVEVSDMKTSLAFYHDLFGLPVKSHDGHFAMLQAGLKP